MDLQMKEVAEELEEQGPSKAGAMAGAVLAAAGLLATAIPALRAE